jgi:hypothetical protein
MADDVSINKAAALERCVARVREEYSGNEAYFRKAAGKGRVVLLRDWDE